MCLLLLRKRRVPSRVQILFGWKKKLIGSGSNGLPSVPSTGTNPPKNPMRYPPPSPKFSPKRNDLGSLNISFNQVVKATRNLSSSSYIGEGRVGRVYKCRLPDGQEVAIKQLREKRPGSTEFYSKVDILSKIGHPNLVRMLGCVDKGNERLILTEYLSNGTLRQHLDGERGKTLDFNQRLEIAMDVAHGLTYLHMYAEKQIFHGDVKSSIILLTDNMKAKVADLAFAIVGPEDAEQTYFLPKMRATAGYADKEGCHTPKSDVYSFGIIILEILTGRRPLDQSRPPGEKNLHQCVFYNFKKGNVLGLVDPLMEESVNEDILRKMFDLAILCTAPVRADPRGIRAHRPDMKNVGERLWAIRMDYRSQKENRALQKVLRL